MRPSDKMRPHRPVGAKSNTSNRSVSESTFGQYSMVKSHASTRQQSIASTVLFTEDENAKAAADALGRDLKAMGYNLDRCESFLTRGTNRSEIDERYAAPLASRNDSNSFYTETKLNREEQEEDDEEEEGEEESNEESSDDDSDDSSEESDSDSSGSDDSSDDNDESKALSETETEQSKVEQKARTAPGLQPTENHRQPPVANIIVQPTTGGSASSTRSRAKHLPSTSSRGGSKDESGKSAQRSKSFFPENPEREDVEEAESASEQSSYQVSRQSSQGKSVDLSINTTNLEPQNEEDPIEEEGSEVEVSEAAASLKMDLPSVAPSDEPSDAPSEAPPDEADSSKGAPSESSELTDTVVIRKEKMSPAKRASPARSPHTSPNHPHHRSANLSKHSPRREWVSAKKGSGEGSQTTSKRLAIKKVREGAKVGGKIEKFVATEKDQDSECTGPSEQNQLYKKRKDESNKPEEPPLPENLEEPARMRSIRSEFVGESLGSPKNGDEQGLENIVIDGMSMLDGTTPTPKLPPTVPFDANVTSNARVNVDSSANDPTSAEERGDESTEKPPIAPKARRGFWSRKQLNDTNKANPKSSSKKESSKSSKKVPKSQTRSKYYLKPKNDTRLDTIEDEKITTTKEEPKSRSNKKDETTLHIIESGKKKSHSTRAESPTKIGRYIASIFHKKRDEEGPEPKRKPRAVSPLRVITTENEEGFDVELISPLPGDSPSRRNRSPLNRLRHRNTQAEINSDFSLLAEMDRPKLSDILTLEDTTVAVEEKVGSVKKVEEKSSDSNSKTIQKEKTSSSYYTDRASVSPMKRQSSTLLATSFGDLFNVLVRGESISAPNQQILPTDSLSPSHGLDETYQATARMQSTRTAEVQELYPNCPTEFPCMPKKPSQAEIQPVQLQPEELEEMEHSTNAPESGSLQANVRPRQTEEKSTRSGRRSKASTKSGRTSRFPTKSRRRTSRDRKKKDTSDREKQVEKTKEGNIEFSEPAQARPILSQESRKQPNESNPIELPPPVLDTQGDQTDSVYRTTSLQAEGKTFDVEYETVEATKFGESRQEATIDDEDEIVKRLNVNPTAMGENESPPKLKKKSKKSKSAKATIREKKNISSLLDRVRSRSSILSETEKIDEVGSGAKEEQTKRARSKSPRKSRADLPENDPVVALDGARQTRKKSPLRSKKLETRQKDPIVTVDRNIPMANETWKPGSPPRRKKSSTPLPAEEKEQIKSFAEDWAEVADATLVLEHVMSTVGDHHSNGTLDEAELLLSVRESNFGDVEKALATLKKHANRMGVSETDLLLATAKSYDTGLMSDISFRGAPTIKDDFVGAISSYMSFRK